MVVKFGSFQIDPSDRRLSRGGVQVDIGDRAFDILAALAAADGRVVSKEDLLRAVWPNLTVEENSLHVQVFALRKALVHDSEADGHIVTVHRRGYRLSGISRALLPRALSVEPGRVPRIAVLPFTSLGEESDQEYFADGIVEDIITALSRLPSVCVIARNSSFALRDRTENVREMGALLDARYLLTGSVRRTANRIRVFVQLVETDASANLWADRFDGELEDMFDFQDQITERVLSAIAPQIEFAEIARSRTTPKQNLVAYDHYLRGLAKLYRGTASDSQEALDHFFQAIALDPEFSSPYGGAVNCYLERRMSAWADDFEREATEVTRLGSCIATLGRNDSAALAYASIGLTYIVGDLEAGAPLAERALQLNHNLTAAIFAAAAVHLFRGNAQEALNLFMRAIQLSPLDPHLSRFQTGAAGALLLAGRLAEARDLATRILAEKATYLPALHIVAASFALQGRDEDGRKVLARALELDRGLNVANFRNRIGPYRAEPFERYIGALQRIGLPD